MQAFLFITCYNLLGTTKLDEKKPFFIMLYICAKNPLPVPFPLKVRSLHLIYQVMNMGPDGTAEYRSKHQRLSMTCICKLQFDFVKL